MALSQQRLKEVWNNWEVEISILSSLLLQIILILSANLRKRTPSKRVSFVLWMAYLAADWVANFSLGIISSTLNDPGSAYNPDILAFWTPFLLLHLGGPDTITAFSLEDSQLWLRHVLSLIFQFVTAGYIFLRSLKPHGKLFFPTLCVLAAAVLKYGERIWSLKQASMEGLRKSLIKEPVPGPDYAAVMEDFSSNLRAGNPGMLKQRPRHHAELLYGAYLFFQTFKCLFVDLILTFQDRNHSVSMFRKCSPAEAYKMIEIELSYNYDILYTKALVVHTKKGRIFRAISFSLTLIAFCLFFSTVKQHDFKNKKDIIVSYVLLAGALVLDFVSIAMLILSDWTVVMLRKANWKRLAMIVFQILSIFRPLSKHQWSNHMGQYSLLSYIVDQKPKNNLVNYLDCLGLKEMWEEYKYINHNTSVSENLLMQLIFENLKEKSKESEQDERLNTRQGQWVLKLPKDCSMHKHGYMKLI